MNTPSPKQPKKQPIVPLEPAELGDDAKERDDFEDAALDAHGHGEQKDAPRDVGDAGTGATHGEE